MLGFGEVISSTEMRIIDRNASALGVSTLQLMESAGKAVADVVDRVLGGARGKRIVVFAGAGGNAGDGLTAARHLASRGAFVTVYLLSKPSELHGETLEEYRAVEVMDLTIELRLVRDVNDIPASIEADAVIDALLGIGARGRLRSVYARAVEAINASRAVKIAIDVPTGIDPDTGAELGTFVRADVTVCLHKLKPGLVKRRDAAGELVIADIGIPREAEIYVGPGDVEFRLPRRQWNYHKGMGGRVLIVGGSEQYTGAPILAALAALRAGVDLVFLAAPERAAEAAAHQTPELITLKLPGGSLRPEHVRMVAELAGRVDAVAIGMGVGLSEESLEAIIAIVESLGDKPMVLDADALKALSRRRDLLAENIVLTPHAAEFQKLFGTPLPGPEKVLSRAEIVAETARKHRNTTILLKGPIDVISNGVVTRLNKTGAPAMSVGGTGDVLAGLVAALLAKKLEPVHAASVAAFINGVAGALAYARKGDSITPLDIIDAVPEVLADPYNRFRETLVYRRLGVEKVWERRSTSGP